MEFTYQSYRNLLDKLHRHGYDIVGYEDWEQYERCAVLRHDVDNDLGKAVDLALLEQKVGVKATYFVLITSDFYNVFSKESGDSLKRIMDCGHTIGLHFDEVRYPEIVGNIEVIKDKIIEELRLLEVAINKKVKVVSMHRPSKSVLEADLKIPGITNSYGWKFFKEFKYLSDSRRRWREPIDEIIDGEKYARLHILTHAFWYNNVETDIHDSVSHFVNDGNRKRYQFMESNITDLASIMRKSEVK